MRITLLIRVSTIGDGWSKTVGFHTRIDLNVGNYGLRIGSAVTLPRCASYLTAISHYPVKLYPPVKRFRSSLRRFRNSFTDFTVVFLKYSTIPVRFCTSCCNVCLFISAACIINFNRVASSSARACNCVVFVA